MESSECSICFNEIEISCHTFNSPTALFTTKCGHKFHNRCISIWCQTNNSCPICRKKNVYQSQSSSSTSRESTNNFRTSPTSNISNFNSDSFRGIINTTFIDNFINLNINIQNNNNINNYITNTTTTTTTTTTSTTNNDFRFNRYILENLNNN